MSNNPWTIAQPNGGDRALRILEDLFLILTAVYLLYAMKGMTMFKPDIPDTFLPGLRLAMELVALALLIKRPQKRPEIWLGLALVGVYAATYQSTAHGRTPYLAIMVMGLSGVDYRKIVRTYIAAVGAVLLATVIAGLGGGIENIVYFREGLRSCWGTSYPTDFSSLVLFLTMAVWIAWPGLPDWTMLLLGLVPLALAIFITASRNSLLCGALFELVVCYHWLERGALRRVDQKKTIRRVADAVLMAAAPACAAVIFLLVFMYARHPDAMERLDTLLSFRLRFSADAVQTYGLKPFGTYIAMHGGNGGTVFPKGEMFYLDSSYINILLCYGWVTMLAMFTAWEYTLYKALRGGNRRMALVMAVIAVHSIMEHHFADPFHNILLVMPLAMLAVKPQKEAIAWRDKKACAAFCAVAVALVALVALFMPRLMSALRTIYGARGWQGGGTMAWPVLGFNLAIVALTAAGAWAAYRLLLAALTRKPDRLALSLCVFLLCGALGVGCGAWGRRVIAQAAQDHGAMVEADAEALSCLSEYEVCPDVLPEVYRQRFANVRRTTLGGDDLARVANSVVLMDSHPEHRLFIMLGYKYVPISDAHALYVSNPNALAALEAHGFVASDIYNTVTSIDLEELARLNNLTMENGGLLLNGTKQSVTKSVENDMFSGQYTVEFRLALPEGSPKKGEICELRVYNKPLGVISTLVVDKDQFDSEGRATIAMPLGLGGDTIGVQFQVIARKNRQVVVEGIRYWQTPAQGSDDK